MHQGSQTLESIAHDEGRFLAVQGALNDFSGSNSGILTPKGEGVLMRLSGEKALQYMQDVQEEGKFEIYQIEKAIIHFYHS